MFAVWKEILVGLSGPVSKIEVDISSVHARKAKGGGE